MSAPSLSLLKKKLRQKKRLGSTEMSSAIARGLIFILKIGLVVIK